MECLILGCGEAFDETLPNTSVLLRTHATVLCDCGYSAPPQIWKAAPAPDAIDLIYISHAHADHYFGLPALLSRMWEDGRTRPLSVVSQPAVIAQIKDVLEYGYRGLAARYRYPIEYVEAIAGQTVRLSEVTLDFAPSRHAVANLAVRIEAEGKRFCYSGDGMFTDEGRKLFSGADLLIHEGYFFDQSPVHADIGALLQMSAEEKVRRMALVHVQRNLRREPASIHDAIRRGYAERVSLPEPGTRYEI